MVVLSLGLFSGRWLLCTTTECRRVLAKRSLLTRNRKAFFEGSCLVKYPLIMSNTRSSSDRVEWPLSRALLSLTTSFFERIGEWGW